MLFPPLHLRSPSQLPPQHWIDPLSPTAVTSQPLQLLAGIPALVYHSQDLSYSLGFFKASLHPWVGSIRHDLCHLIPSRRQLPSWDFPHSHPRLGDLTLVTGLTAQAPDTTPNAAI